MVKSGVWTRIIPHSATSVIAGLMVLAIAGSAAARDVEWTDPVDGSFTNSANWTVTAGGGSGPPVAGDNVFFNEPGTYFASFVSDPTSDSLELLNDSNVSFLSTSAAQHTYSVNSGGTGDLVVHDGAQLTIGRPGNPIFSTWAVSSRPGTRPTAR